MRKLAPVALPHVLDLPDLVRITSMLPSDTLYIISEGYMRPQTEFL